MKASELRHQIKEAYPSIPMPAWAKQRPITAVAAVAGGAALAASGAQGAWEGAEYGLRKGFKAMGNKIQNARSYKKLLKENEDLEDTPETRKAFNTMHRFAPDVAKDPMVAGTFVKRVTRFGEEVDPNWVKTLVDIQSRHEPGYVSSGMGNIFAQNFSRGLQMGIEGGVRGDQFERTHAQKEETNRLKGLESTQRATEAGQQGQGNRAQMALSLMTLEQKKELAQHPKVAPLLTRHVRTELNKTAEKQLHLDHMRALRHRSSLR